MKKSEREKRFIKVAECLVRYRANGVYYARIKRHGKQILASLKTNDRKLADRLLIDFQQRHATLDPARGQLRLIDLVARYRATYAHLSEKTKSYRGTITKRILECWPDKLGAHVPVTKVRRHHCVEWLNQFQIGAVSRNAHVGLLRKIFQLAIKDGVIVDSPAAELERGKIDDPIRKTPSFEQFEVIIQSVRSQKFNGHGAEDSADFLEFMGLAGLGQAEASALTRGDVHFESEQIGPLKRRKTGKKFSPPIFPQVRPLLEKLCEGKAHNAKLFKIADAKKALAAACKRLSFPPFSQRSLRRMFITRAIERGVDVKVIAEWQGHSDGGKLILGHYSHVRRPHSQRMAQLMTKEGGAA